MSALIEFLSGLVLPLVTGVAGFAIGWFVRDFVGGAKRGIDAYAIVIGLVITFLWFTSVLVSMTTPEYQTAPGVHLIMGAVAGYFFTGGKNPLRSRDDSET